MKTPQKEIDKIIELHLAGLSSRKIVKQLETVKSKSTVNNIIALWKDGVIKATDEVCDDTEEATVDDSNNIDILIRRFSCKNSKYDRWCYWLSA